ncbi:MAG: hypothetical protein QXK80_01555 [Candidatus Pacearchaeota archaeon]
MKLNKFLIFLVVAVIASISLIKIEAQQSEQTTISNVTVAEYVAIGLSTDLAEGILFGSVDPATNDNNATKNYAGAGGATTYYVAVSSDSNVNVDLCIKDNAPLTSSGGQTIPNNGYTWDDDSSGTGPTLPGTAMSTTYVKTGVTNIAPGDNDYFRFWLDIPAGQPAGVYNNTVYFKGIKVGESC